MSLFELLTVAFALVTSIVWIVIGWRAMRAHEDLANSVIALRRDVSQIAERVAGDESAKR